MTAAHHLPGPPRVWSSPHLPSLPAAAVRLLTVCSDPEVDLGEVVRLIRTDPAMSAKLLKAANSSYFGFRSEITGVERAVPLLGAATVRSLALSFSLSDDSVADGPLAEHYRAYWRQSVVQAAAAEVFGERLGPGAGGEMFLAGLLCDLGRLALLRAVPDEYLAVLEGPHARDEPAASLPAAERDAFGADHAEIGATLAGRWGLPDVLTRAIALHHADGDRLAAVHADGDGPGVAADLILCTAAAAAAAEYCCSETPGPALVRLRRLGERFFGLTGPSLTEAIEQVTARAALTADLLDADVSDIGPASDLMARANENLAEIAARSSAEAARSEARRRELEQEHRQLQERSLRDRLTGLFNRAYFDETLAREVSHAGRSASTVGVLFADVDHFKQVNDAHGHGFGDEVLRGVAEAFRRVLRRSDVAARWGGEEFVVMIPQPSEGGLAAVAERLRAAVEQAEFTHGGRRVPITASFGAALAVPAADSDDGDRLVRTADEAMYAAKRDGRNRVVVRSLLSPTERALQARILSRRLSRWLAGRGHLSVAQLGEALPDLDPHRTPVGALAERCGVLSPGDARRVAAQQFETGERFGEAAVRMGLMNEEVLAELLARQQENPRELADALIRRDLVPAGEMHRLLAEHAAEGPLAVTARDPADDVGPVAAA